MNVLAFALLVAAFSAMCLGSERYAGRVGFSHSLAKPAILRVTGWILLLAALPACVAESGPSIGAVVFLGLLSAAAGLIMLIMAYKPRLLPKATLLITLLGAALAAAL